MATRPMIPRPPKPMGKTSNTAPNDAMATAPGDGQMGDAQGKESAEQAGYMELDGAQKDADCQIVTVPGGVSSQLGCCNEFTPQEGAQTFSCGTCNFVTEGQQQPDMSQMPGEQSSSEPVNNMGEI